MNDGQQTDPQVAPPPRSEDLPAFFRELEASGRFHRDKGIGRIFHPGAVSYRERVPENCLHIVVRDGRVSAHIDRYSPVRFTKDGEARYSFWRIAVHNVSGMVKDVLRLLTGRREGAEEGVEASRLGDLLNERRDGPGGSGPGRDSLHAGLHPRADESVGRVPFNLIDDVVHLLDTPAEPWTVQMEVRVTGRLDEGRLRAALGEGIRRHPMARARKVATQASWNRNYWETPPDLDVDPLEVTDCADDASLDSIRAQLYSLPIPLSESPPLRARLARRRDGDILMLSLNHTATDGIGGLRLLHSMARAYAGAPDPLPDLDFLAARDLMGGHAAADAATRVRRYLAVVERLREVLAPPARLARHQGREGPGYGFHHVRLSAEETQGVTSLGHAGSVNDVLVAALHMAIAAWNGHHRVPCRRITVLVPSNLRPPDQRSEMVGNFSLPARISTTARRRTRAAVCLAAVTAQTSRKKTSGMGTSLLELLSWSWLLPLPVKRAAIDLLDRRFTDTVVLSNLGRVEDPPSFGGEAGETVELWFSAPARMPLGLSVGAITTRGRLHLVLRYRLPQFGPEAVRRFAELYRAQLRRLVAQPEGDARLAASRRP